MSERVFMWLLRVRQCVKHADGCDRVWEGAIGKFK
jgi:hypothetical protein